MLQEATSRVGDARARDFLARLHPLQTALVLSGKARLLTSGPWLLPTRTLTAASAPGGAAAPADPAANASSRVSG